MLKLAKIFAEVRIEQSYLHEDARTRNELLKELKKYDFTMLDHENKGILIFINIKQRANLQIHTDRIVLDIDEPEFAEKIKTLGNEPIQFIMRRLEATTTERIGVRAHYIDMDEKNNRRRSLQTAKKFFHENLMWFIENNLGEVDIATKIGFTIKVNHEFKLNVGIGLQNRVIANAFNNTNTLHLLDTEEQYQITDLDIYSEVPKDPKQLNGMLQAACAYLSEYQQKIWSL